MKNIRWHVFWALDFLKGRPVRKYYNQVKSCYLNGTTPAYTQTRSHQLIRHAINTTRFYGSYNKDFDLNQLPVMNKNIYKENYDKFLSSQFINAKSNRIKNTSGSTGIPFEVIQDKNKILHNTAASIFLCTLGKYFIGMKQAYIRVWLAVYMKSRLSCFLENVSMIDTSNLDEMGLINIIDQIYRKKFTSIFSYASSLEAINRYMNENPSAIRKSPLKSIISMSEMLPEPVRLELSEKFSCPVKSIYSNEENGIMGIQTTEGKNYYLDTTSYIFEFLELESDTPVKEGELGRIVVTDLFNFAFPMIRYDTGDLAKYRETNQNGRKKIILEDLFGRRDDTIFDCNGNELSPFKIANEIYYLKGIKQWQFIQVDKRKYKLILNLESDRLDEGKIHKLMSQILGDNADVEIQYTEEIPVLNSGKRRTIVNKYIETTKRNTDNI